MRVFHFNTASAGGAAATMVELHKGLNLTGFESHYKTRDGSSGGDGMVSVGTGGRIGMLSERIRKRLYREVMKGGHNLFTSPRGGFKTPVLIDLRRGDIVHLHWIQHWLDLPSFLRAIPKEVPIVWTAHDLALFSGGCHIYGGCEGFTDSCSPCPLLKAPFDRFLGTRGLKSRVSLLGNHTHAFIGNSTWMLEAIHRSRIGKEASLISRISPSIDLTSWTQVERKRAREKLGIRDDVVLLGFGAAEITDLNKNFRGFLDCVRRVAMKENVEALVFGDGSIDVAECPVPIKFLGSIVDPARLSLCYSAMDVMVVPSFFETFGLVAVEAQACGTPVVAYAVGGLTDAVCPLPQGNLVPAYDVEAIADVVLNIARDQTGEANRSETVSQYVRNRFCSSAAAREYSKVYKRLLAEASLK